MAIDKDRIIDRLLDAWRNWAIPKQLAGESNKSGASQSELSRAADRAIHARELEKEIDRIQRERASLRDDLVDRVRLGESDQESASGRPRPDQYALSLIVMVEYPLTTLQRSAIERARDTLKNTLSAQTRAGQEVLS
jgi:hypothetical protein